MPNKIIKVLFLVAILFGGCRTPKIVERVKIERHDSIIEKEVVKITPPVINTITIEKPCDSLGNLKPFKVYSGSGKSGAAAFSRDNEIVIECNCDSAVNAVKSTYKSTSSEKESELKETRSIIPRWAWWSLAANIVLTLYFANKFRRIF